MNLNQNSARAAKLHAEILESLSAPECAEYYCLVLARFVLGSQLSSKAYDRILQFSFKAAAMPPLSPPQPTPGLPAFRRRST